jgi:hypothetical protein
MNRTKRLEYVGEDNIKMDHKGEGTMWIGLMLLGLGEKVTDIF